MVPLYVAEIVFIYIMVGRCGRALRTERTERMTYATGTERSPDKRNAVAAGRPLVREPGKIIEREHLNNLRRMAGKPDKLHKTPKDAGSNSREYFVEALLDDGSVTSFTQRAPAAVSLEDVCANFARGSLIAIENGQVAVEDLRPGDKVKTRDNGCQTVRWIGSCALAQTTDMARWPLRIKADALGELRPIQDLVVSPRFRLLSNHPSCKALFGSSETLAPAADLLDGDTIMRVRPASDLMFYNLMFDAHQIIDANGLETESYHPGNFGVAVMSAERQSYMQQLLRHLEGDLNRFGRTARPLLKGFEAEVLRVG